MRRVIFNQKGGVGKSSIAVNLAAISAERGLKTLVLDLDPQGNASQYLLGDAAREVDRDLADFFEQFMSFRLLSEGLDAFARPTSFENLSLAASSPKLTYLQSRLETRHKIYKLREALEELDGFDAVYIDTPPAYNFYTLSALIASDACLIPFDCDDFSRRALYTLLDNVAEVRADHNPRLQVEGIVVNQFDTRANLPKRVVKQLKEDDLPVLDTKLPPSVVMRESHEQATPLVYLAPRHKLTRRFVTLYDELQRKAA